jgi:hypothetical protein
MTLAKGVNSYATVGEADAYFADRVDVPDWLAANSTKKGQALVTATRVLDMLDWVGIVVSDTQSLSFPRVGAYFDPKLGYQKNLSGVPDRIVTATYELANHFLINTGILDDTGRVIDLNLSNLSLGTIINPGVIPSSVLSIIRPIRRNLGTRMWFRAN